MKNNYRKFYLVMLIFIIPMIASSVLFYFNHYFHFKTSNHGNLVNPAIQLATLQIEPVKKWQIMYVPQQCDNQQSEKMTFTLHQLRIALGKNYDRVALTLAVDNRCHLKDTHDFARLTLQDKQINQLEKLLRSQTTSDFNVHDKIYLVDPLGNLFMYYAVTDNPMNILKDIKHVLEVSQIG